MLCTARKSGASGRSGSPTTPSCNWDTWEQLCHREEQDASADLCNSCFTPLTTWEEQVKAAIVAARQETVAFSKDGKTLFGPVLPRLQARYNHGKGGDWVSHLQVAQERNTVLIRSNGLHSSSNC